jgi:hypothetical protein
MGVYGRCDVCGEIRVCNRRYAYVNPRTGLGYRDVVRNPRTGGLNSQWPKGGKWVLVCGVCLRKPGLNVFEHKL